MIKKFTDVCEDYNKIIKNWSQKYIFLSKVTNLKAESEKLEKILYSFTNGEKNLNMFLGS